MTPLELARMRAEAAAEFAKDEPLMLVAPVAVLGLLDELERFARERTATGRYDMLLGDVSEADPWAAADEERRRQPHAFVLVPGSGPFTPMCDICASLEEDPIHF